MRNDAAFDRNCAYNRASDTSTSADNYCSSSSLREMDTAGISFFVPFTSK
ncbi:hypothetical protein X777_08398 [Ooceraea biroi]|uniref:Uncharacterized protein n=1 Tax=Ooceraea biroi TaxID=2015173 RepID=A0A026WZN0_OOCBI|nr:hypothetical protein X777_08398 [Ooceraea biroi]